MRAVMARSFGCYDFRSVQHKPVCYENQSMATRPPGKRVRGSSTGRPIMVALDLLGRRGALRILWELRGDPLTFRALQEAAQAQPGLLNSRPAELREAGIVSHDDGGYPLSAAGRAC